ncbi:MAG TPA: cytochrome c biogenesis CcdA family protein [Candidatus Dojkabacteria bacterium]|nr:cytochrome c biogenesis CcdA family protein [Candidatus Dojkabacteria bacterium]
MDYSLIIPAFIAGLASFFMPCTFPLVPSFLAFVSGSGKAEKLNTLKNAFFFILGFSLVFVFFGIIAGLIGNHLGQYRVMLSRVGGVVIIIFGLLLMDVIKINSLKKSFKIKLPKLLKPGTPRSSFLVGSSIGLGWSPCIGPILGSILLLASTSSTVWQGAILLLSFSLGLGLPFFLTALFGVTILNKIYNRKNILKYINLIGGILLVLLGLMQLTDKLSFFMGKFYQIDSSFLLDYL